MKHILLKADAVLFICVIIAGIFGLLIFSGGGTAQGAIIRKNGETVMQVNLDKDEVIRVENVTLEVQGGAIRFVQSNCPGQQCVHAGFISRPGSSMVCLPNRISVTLLGQSEVDAVAE